MSNYVLETPDEFATRRNNENINNFNNGYETALLDILEMIETDASYDEVYESINEYLLEGNQKLSQEKLIRMGDFSTDDNKEKRLEADALKYTKRKLKGTPNAAYNAKRNYKNIMVGIKNNVRDVNNKNAQNAKLTSNELINNTRKMLNPQRRNFYPSHYIRKQNGTTNN